MMYLHKAPHRPWWPSPDKFKEFSKKHFQNRKLYLMIMKIEERQQKQQK